MTTRVCCAGVEVKDLLGGCRTGPPRRERRGGGKSSG